MLVIFVLGIFHGKGAMVRSKVANIMDQRGNDGRLIRASLQRNGPSAACVLTW